MKNEKQFEVRDRRAKDRFYLDDLYLNGYAKLCGIYATGVYLSLCRHSNLDQNCWPSIKKIAEELAISQTQTRRAIKRLEECKIISKERLGKKLTNRYWLLNKSEWSGRTITDCPDRTLIASPQDTHQRPGRTLHSKEAQYKETHSKERRTFSPPPLQEVSSYCLERQNGIDAQNFVDFYSSKGWLIGKNKMKDWRAAIRTWEARNKQSQKPNNVRIKGDIQKYERFT